jgi:putative phage-type endonuclease
MRLINLDQGGNDWLVWRAGGIGGSDSGVIMGVSPYCTREKLLGQKAVRRFGITRQTNTGKTDAMLRGIEKEPMVRDTYNKRTGQNLVPACGIHDKYQWMRASFDGLLLPDFTRALEIKCPNKNVHQSALDGIVATLYWPQVQHLLAVSGADRLDFVSWSENPFFGDRQLARVIVRPDWPYIEEMIEAEKIFMEEVMAARAKFKKPKHSC